MGFEETVIHCSAPALCGIKPASLFSLKNEFYSINRSRLFSWRKNFSKDRRFFVIIKKEDGRVLIFVYDKNLLEEVCSKKKNQEYLKTKGYEVEKGFNSILSELLFRLAHENSFPHETGLFLGYPLEDVIGFETQNAKNCVFSGFWKVYGDKQAALDLMKKYRLCTEICMSWFRQGLSVPLAAQKYKKMEENL